MRRLTYRVSLEPIPVTWADEFIAALFEAVPDVDGDGMVVGTRRPLVRVRRVTGSHLEPGSTYTVRGVRDGWPRASVLVGSWSSVATTVMSAVVLGKRRGAAVVRGEYSRKPRPGVINVSGALRPRPGKISMLQLSASAEVDLAAWYDGAADAVATGRLESPAGAVTVEVAGPPPGTGTWEAEITVAFSHWYTLPLLRSALLIERRLGGRRDMVDRIGAALGGAQLRREANGDLEYLQLMAEQALRQAEVAWNTAVPDLVNSSPESVARDVITQAIGR